MQVLEVFVSSPGDVEAERQRVGRVVARLNGEFREVVRLELIRWEEHFYTADRSFQEQIAETAADRPRRLHPVEPHRLALAARGTPAL